MKTIVEKCPAKINLSLDVIGNREDGYHELKMIMQTVDIFDYVTVSVCNGDGIYVTCDKEGIPSGEENIAYVAAELFLKHLNIKRKVDIKIEKHIPDGAGLAGGSSDAAGVLRALFKIEGKIKEEELLRLAKKVGADVPFCIKGGCCLCEGIGEVLTPIKGMENVVLVVIKPPFSVNTKSVYKKLDLGKHNCHPDTERLLKALLDKDYKAFKIYGGNTLECVTKEDYPVIGEYEELLYSKGAIFSMMSGSGPTVFGVFENIDMAEDAYRQLKEKEKEVFFLKL